MGHVEQYVPEHVHRSKGEPLAEDEKFRRVGTVSKVEGVKKQDGTVVANLFKVVLNTDEGERTCSYSTNVRKGEAPNAERIAALGLAQQAQLTGEPVVVSGYISEKGDGDDKRTFYNGTAIKPLAQWQQEHPDEQAEQLPTPKPSSNGSPVQVQQAVSSNDEKAAWALRAVLDNIAFFPEVPNDAQERADWMKQKAVALARMRTTVAKTLDDRDE